MKDTPQNSTSLSAKAWSSRSVKMIGILEYILFIFAILQKHGVDWFRQQDQWVSKHAENRSAISLIPCYKILTGDQEFALAA